MADEKPSLREMLGSAPDPEFELTLPRGWERSAPTADAQVDLERRLSRKLMSVGSVDAMHADARLRGVLRQAMNDMRERKVVAWFAPSAETDGPPFPVPASIVATIRSAPTTQLMDGYVKGLITKDGARPLADNRALLRLERENVREEGGARVVLSSTLYVTPVPGSRRRRALELLAGYGRPADVPRDDEEVEFLHTFFDLMVSTLRWREPARE